MKKIIMLITVILLTTILSACSSDALKNGSTDVLLDVTKYSKISSEELIKKMGEPESIEENYLNGTLYSFTTDLGHFEFIVHDNMVTRLTLHSFLSWESIGTDFPYKGDPKTLIEFGIDPSNIDKNAEKTDTGVALRISPVTDKVADFWVSGIKNNDSFDTLKVTYDTKPYEQ